MGLNKEYLGFNLSPPPLSSIRIKIYFFHAYLNLLFIYFNLNFLHRNLNEIIYKNLRGGGGKFIKIIFFCIYIFKKIIILILLKVIE